MPSYLDAKAAEAKETVTSFLSPTNILLLGSHNCHRHFDYYCHLLLNFSLGTYHHHPYQYFVFF